jgi:transcriptional regulator with XRE-family HTH domain
VSGDGGHLANTLPRLLGIHNLSGAKLAAHLGVSTQYVWMLMNGERAPTDARLHKIARLFGIDAERLLDAPFEELLQAEIADPSRYRETEKRIATLKRRERARGDTTSAATR